MAKIGPISSISPSLATDQSWGGVALTWTVASNAVGFGAILRPGAAGSLVEADNEETVYPGLFMALEAGTGERRVLSWGGGLVRNDAWAWTPGAALYISTTDGELTQVDTGGHAVGFSKTADVIYFGPVHAAFSSLAPAEITITISGVDFEAITTLDTDTYPDATINWVFPDASESTDLHPDVSGVGAGDVVLTVSDGRALIRLSLGYDGADGGATFEGGFGAADGPYALAQQNVTAITGLTSAVGLTHLAVSNNPVVALDLSGLASISVVEAYLCEDLASVNTSGCVGIRRWCTEGPLSGGSLDALDLSASHALEDIRSANQLFDELVLPDAEYCGAIWHICIHDQQPGLSVNLPTDGRFTGIEQYWLWDNLQTGALVLTESASGQSVAVYDNQYTSIDVHGLYDPARSCSLNAADNLLGSADISNNPSLTTVNLSDNSFGATAVDTILGQCVANSIAGGTTGGTIDLTGNAAPTSTGLAHVATLEGRSWTVNVEASTAPYVTGYSPTDNEEDVELDATCALTFSEIVNAVSGNITMVETGVGNAEVFDVATDISGSGTAEISFSPTAWDRNKDYHFLIDSGAFENSVEVAYTGITDPTVWNIKTRPMYDTLSPADDASSVAVDSAFEIVFPEAMTAQAGGEIRIHLSSDDSTVEAFDVIADISGDGTDTLGFTPTANLDPSEEYYVQIDQGSFQNPGLEDFEGILNATDWNITTASASSSLWEDLFDRAAGPVGNGWVSTGAATITGEINASQQLETDGASSYQQFSNPCTAENLPANYRVTVTVPNSQLSEGYWGIGLRYLPLTTFRGTRLFFVNSSSVSLGNASSFNSGNVTIDTTGGGWTSELVASWATDKNHTAALEVIGSTCNIYLDGYYYGTATHEYNNQTGTGIALLGELGTANDTFISVIVESAS